MKITDIRVKRIVTDAGKLRAIVSVTFDDAFVVNDIKIIEGQDKLFTAMPSRKTPDGEFRDVAHPINAEMRNMMEEAILLKYHKALEENAEA